VVDVLGFEGELLAMVPQPVAALILLYPVKDEKEFPTEDGDRAGSVPRSAYFMRQTIRNACGTIALIHAVGNSQDKLTFSDTSVLKAFLDVTKDLGPEERGKQLEANLDICACHETSAQEGQTSAPGINEEVDFHFVAFVQKEGQLLEMDGRKSGPTAHGATSDDTFLSDAAAVCRKFMDKNPDCLSFTAVALAKV
jgi:ubiquitin carboxyl-terminal hydrolase L3